jgi:geranylgeranyl pyrophosphate synthase
VGDGKNQITNEDLDVILSIVESNHGFEKTVSVTEQYVKEAKSSIGGLRDPRLLLSLFKS